MCRKASLSVSEEDILLRDHPISDHRNDSIDDARQVVRMSGYSG